MKIPFPSREFDDAVAAVCHGQANDGQMQALNELLRANPAARDDYLLRVELHSRLASAPDLFASAADPAAGVSPLPATDPNQTIVSLPLPSRRPMRRTVWALAAAIALLAAVSWALWQPRSVRSPVPANALAVLTFAENAQWARSAAVHPVGAGLAPGWLRLKSGLVQVVFHSGARVVIQGPAELQLLSRHEVFCRAGLVSVEVPARARGFCVRTPQVNVVDLGTAFGLDLRNARTEVHVFKGEVALQTEDEVKQSLRAGEAVAVEDTGVLQRAPLNPAAFAPALALQQKWLAREARRYAQWRGANARLNQDRSLLVHFDLEGDRNTDAVLPNVARPQMAGSAGEIVGCQWTEGRWPGKRALDFQSPDDQVRLTVPGEFPAVTLTAWVRIRGLERPFNSLFMCDGFSRGTVHWQIRNDGVLDLGVQGPRVRDVQIFASPPVVGFNEFGPWLHLAVVVDGSRRQVSHYFNGHAVSRQPLGPPPPFRIGASQLGNWNIGQSPNAAPFFIRHFNGVMDEFALFSRALSDAEIRALYNEGKPQAGP